MIGRDGLSGLIWCVGLRPPLPQLTRVRFDPIGELLNLVDTNQFREFLQGPKDTPLESPA
jgi:hypothetical protein